MRKLELRSVSRITSVAAEMEETPGGLTETRQFEAADGKRLFIVVIKSDDISEQGLIRLKDSLKQKFENIDGDVALLAMGAEDSLEIYEVGKTPALETSKSD